MQRFILLDLSATDTLLTASKLQSADFDAGASLAALVKNGTEASLGVNLHAIRLEDGLALLGNEPTLDRCLVFDLESVNPFESLRSSEALLVLQRAARCAHKVWRNLPASPCERVVRSAVGGHKLILFPFPYGSNSQWRLTIQRTTVADNEGDYLLAFRWGRDEAGGPDEVPSKARLHLAVSQLRKLDLEEITRPADDSVARPPLRSYALEDEHSSPMALPYEGWQEHLTRPQSEFASRPLVGPEKLEGPAGTGKTLALMLKTVSTLRAAETAQREHHALFVTHSTATRQAIAEKLLVIDHQHDFQSRDRFSCSVSLTITTLQEWCAERLGGDIQEVEYLDRDAADAKVMQLLYISDVLGNVLENDLQTHAQFMSQEFVEFLEVEGVERLAEMFQHEISVMIKGRAEEDLENYQQLVPLKHNLPLHNAADRGFVFLVYRRYANALEGVGQFDTDDIVLTAIGQLNTPVWRRRRAQEGFHSIFVDETHLFNINELSIIHYLTVDPSIAPPIAFAIDRSQAIGDRGLHTGILEAGLLDGIEIAHSEVARTVFRSSREIVDLALAVTASGATLFTNFENPLEEAASGFTAAEERLARVPWYEEIPTDEEMLETAFLRADEMADRLPGGRAGIAVVVFDPVLLKECRRRVRDRNRPFEILERRGDLELVSRARETSRFVLSAPEFVGGLEFDGVVLVAVDQGRVPVDSRSDRIEARHFAQFAAHNLLYVAVSRARFEVCILANRERGLSEILKAARTQGFLVDKNAEQSRPS